MFFWRGKWKIYRYAATDIFYDFLLILLAPLQIPRFISANSSTIKLFCDPIFAVISFESIVNSRTIRTYLFECLCSIIQLQNRFSRSNNHKSYLRWFFTGSLFTHKTSIVFPPHWMFLPPRIAIYVISRLILNRKGWRMFESRLW